MRLLSTAFSATFPTIFLGLAASLQLISFYFYFGERPDWLITSLFFIMTSGTYLLNRISDKEDKFNNVLRWRFFNSNQYKTFFWMILSVIALIAPVFALVILNQQKVAIQFSILAIIGCIYTVRAIPFFKNFHFEWKSIKDIPIGKNIIVCALWAGSALLITATVLEINPFRGDLVLLFITFFIGTCNSNITSDARDVIGDQMRHIKTIPSLLGLKKTYLLLTLINLLGLIIIVVYTSYSLVTLKLGIYAAITIFWAGLSTIPQYFKPDLVSKTIGELLVDSHLFLAAAGLIILCFIY